MPSMMDGSMMIQGAQNDHDQQEAAHDYNADQNIGVRCEALA